MEDAVSTASSCAGLDVGVCLHQVGLWSMYVPVRYFLVFLYVTFWSDFVKLDNDAGRRLCKPCHIIPSYNARSIVSSSKVAWLLGCQAERGGQSVGAYLQMLSCVALALISTMAGAMVVADIYGFSMVFEVQPTVAMTLRAASGISIECGAHLVAPWGA